ncbi:hypothetical protein P691DRAFT_774567 [Macrolepiota fuliginosa MF-IS2]|uniref:DUF6533 domain-containing protein n=1 Tax=Macrolepiota fuliginosa MF-IS2 TaxID=1400762 RepID=A0A9P5XG29_9AGAR|nr:hypothetical protein P691DRAFT_774567 [Macrolepiota fuliginosa MF-IS2]
MLPVSIPRESDLAPAAIRVFYLQHYCQLAAVTIVLYDHFITFDQEVELIWKKRWSKSKILYLVCRYLGDFLLVAETYVYLNRHPTDTLCVILLCRYDSEFTGLWGNRFLAVLAFTSTWTTQLILLLRIQALYGNRTLSKCLNVLYAGGVISLFTIGSMSVILMQVTSEPVPGFHQCTCVKFPSYSFVFFFIILSFDTFLFFLAVGIIVANWRRLSYEALSFQCAVPSLVSIVLRDNFGYFFMASGMYLITTVVWMAAEVRYTSIPTCSSYAVTTIMGCRLILNLCDAYHNPPSGSLTYSYYLTTVASEWHSRPPWESPTTSDVGPTTSRAYVASERQDTGYAANVNGRERWWERRIRSQE